MIMKLYQITVADADGVVVDTGWMAFEEAALQGLAGAALYEELVAQAHDNGTAVDQAEALRIADGDDDPNDAPRHPDAYEYGEPWGPDNPAPGSAWDTRKG